MNNRIILLNRESKINGSSVKKIITNIIPTIILTLGIDNSDIPEKAKDIIKANIDYHISNEFYITDIEKEIMDGKIITLNSKALKHYQNDYTALLNLAADIMGGNKDE